MRLIKKIFIMYYYNNKKKNRILEDFKMKDRINFIRSKIEHEDELISNRINWLLAIQGLLITMYVANYDDLDGYMQFLIIFFGFLSTLNISASICTAERSMSRIRFLFNKKYPQRDFCFPKIIYGSCRDDEYKKRKSERRIICNRLGLSGLKSLNDYDKRLLLGDYESGSIYLKFISKTWILPMLCIFCWVILGIYTVHFDLNRPHSHTKIEINIHNKDKYYIDFDSCRIIRL